MKNSYTISIWILMVSVNDTGLIALNSLIPHKLIGSIFFWIFTRFNPFTFEF